nr:uncharacterized protein LOC117685508 [Crassostrea gigas]XP_034315824.1 uncharacterized protein LOC117685508 [Crassostrea gigas]
MLPNLGIHTLFNETYFWTGHYTRLSGWIKIIGCFEETAVNTLKQKSYEMHFPSAGLCQEVCLVSNYSVFGLQLKQCVCLEQIPKQRSRGANDCSLSCSIKANLTFQNDCGGNKTYSLFKSGLEKEMSAFTKKECLSIQCPDTDKKFVEQECSSTYALICNKTFLNVYSRWQSSSSVCKSKHNSYLLGDVDLTNPEQACNLIQGQPLGLSWIGIAKEFYISIDGVKNEIVHVQSPYLRRCLKCNNKNCVFADCVENNYFVCIEIRTQMISQENTDERFTETSSRSYDTDNETTLTVTFKIKRSTDKKTNSSSSLIAVPVCLSLLLLLVGALALVFIIRKKKSKDSEKREQPHSNDSADYSNVETRTDSDYCELQQPTCTPTNQSADYSQLQFESTSTCNVASDLAVHNAAIERPLNEIYYNMSSAESACINFGLQVDKNE